MAEDYAPTTGLDSTPKIAGGNVLSSAAGAIPADDARRETIENNLQGHLVVVTGITPEIFEKIFLIKTIYIITPFIPLRSNKFTDKWIHTMHSFVITVWCIAIFQRHKRDRI